MTEQENLELQIRTYDANYRAGTPLCTDEVYDSLVEEYKQKFPNSPFFKKAILTQSQKENRKQPLPISMYSLNKIKTFDEFKGWIKSTGVSDKEVLILTAKYDGISLVVEESSKKAWTRGDGEFGQYSENHFKKLRKKHSEFKDLTTITFGEAIMPKAEFIKYKDDFSNPRNLVAGLFNRDFAGDELNDVEYIRYGSNQESLNKNEQIDNLNLINNKICHYKLITVGDLIYKTEFKFYGFFDEFYNKWGIDFQIDGLVIEFNRKELRESLGREENMNPRYARAIKLPRWSCSAIVKVTGVEWGVSKQGKLKPVINIEPTEIGGVTISNVAGYNAKYIFDNNIAIDSIIEIIRSGDVIPKHLSTVSFDRNQVEMLDDDIRCCPSCGELTEWDETNTELVCVNLNCDERRIMKLVHFFSVLEIEEFGEPSIRKLYNAGFKGEARILNLSLKEVLNVNGFGEVSIKKLFEQFDTLKEEGVPFAKLLHAFDVFDGKIGEKTVQNIFDNFDYLDELFNEMGKLFPDKYFTDELIKIDGVAETTARVFQKGISKYFVSDLIENVPINILYIKSPTPEITGSKYTGMKICFTGCRPTKEQEQYIQEQGGEVVSGVSNKTTHLIVKDQFSGSTSSKLQKAKSLNITILSIDDFFKK